MAATRAKDKELFQQVGTFALRSPTGEFLPSVPLFIKAEDAGGVNPSTGLTVAEEIALTDVSKIFGDKMKQYIDGGGLVGKQKKAKK